MVDIEVTEPVTYIRRWCPLCAFFFKSLNGNGCELINYQFEVDEAARQWYNDNTAPSTRINENASGCPRFIPDAGIVQAHWIEANGGMNAVQKAWLKR